MKKITLILSILIGYLLSTVPCHAYRDLETGVFLTRDPADFVDGPNVYTYVRQNPWTHFDPLGLKSESETYWRGQSAQATNPFSRLYAGLRGAAASLNPLNKDSSIREGGRNMSENVAKAAENLNDAPPVAKEIGKFTLGVGSAGAALNPNIFASGLGETVDAVKEQGVVQVGKNMVNGIAHDAVNNPEKLAGELMVAWAGGAAIFKRGNSAPLAPSARTIVSQTQGIADDAMVHFGPDSYSTLKPSPGGDFAHCFQYGDIKHLTPGQVEGAIGTLAESGKKGGAGFMHVLDKPAKVELNGIVPGTKIPEYTFEGETAVKSTHELKR